MPVRDRTVRTHDGVRLAVSEQGDGPPLILIPGLGATRAVFDPIAGPLAGRGRLVIVYDPRGVGASEIGTDRLSMPVMARDARDVIAECAGGRADVLGASMGGVVAQQLALDEPSQVARLILAATSPGGSKAVPPDPRATDALLGRGTRTPADAYRLACTVLYSPQFRRAHPEFIEEQVRQRAAHPVKARTFSAQLRALAESSDLGSRLRSLAVPTLVSHGTADAVTPYENARILAGLIPGARTRWFQDCGHLFFHERPLESARVFDEFLRA